MVWPSLELRVSFCVNTAFCLVSSVEFRVWGLGVLGFQVWKNLEFRTEGWGLGVGGF